MGALPLTSSYETKGGLKVTRTERAVSLVEGVEPIIDVLDTRRGAVFTSTFEYPGRYSRWDVGFVDPPVAIEARGRHLTVRAFSGAGHPLVSFLARAVGVDSDGWSFEIDVPEPAGAFTEEERTRQPSVIAVLRDLCAALASDDDHHLGVYGAFGYDLVFQFEALVAKTERAADQRDL